MIILVSIIYLPFIFVSFFKERIYLRKKESA